MRVLVCGGRNYARDSIAEEYRIWDVLDETHAMAGPIALLMSGAAKGADAQALYWAASRHVKAQRYHADWNAHGRVAGPIRNQRMLDEGKPDLVVAFPGGRGTADMVRRAMAAGVPVREITDNG